MAFNYVGSLTGSSPSTPILREYLWDDRFPGSSGDLCWSGLSNGTPSDTFYFWGLRPSFYNPLFVNLKTPSGLLNGVIHSFTYHDKNNVLLTDAKTFDPSNYTSSPTHMTVKVYADPYALFSIQSVAPTGIGGFPEGLLFDLNYNDSDPSLMTQINVAARNGTVQQVWVFKNDSNGNSLVNLNYPGTTHSFTTMEPFTKLVDSTYLTDSIAIGEGFDTTLTPVDSVFPNPHVIVRLITKNIASPFFWNIQFPTV